MIEIGTKMKFGDIAGSLKRFFGLSADDTETDLFLKSRNARVTVQDANQRSFHAFRLTSCTDIAAFGRNLQLRVKYNNHARTATVTVFDKAANQPIFNLTAPITEEGGTTFLNFADIRLKIDIDAGPLPPK